MIVAVMIMIMMIHKGMMYLFYEETFMRQNTCTQIPVQLTYSCFNQNTTIILFTVIFYFRGRHAFNQQKHTKCANIPHTDMFKSM